MERSTWLPVLAILLIFIGGVLLSFAGMQAFYGNREMTAPQHWIKESRVVFYEDKVIIYVNNTVKSAYIGGSMYPTITANMYGILMPVGDPEQLMVGDIIVFEKPCGARVVHRIIKIGHDNIGWWAYTRGDTNLLRDKGKVRFEQVRGVTVANIY